VKEKKKAKKRIKINCAAACVRMVGE
jgi:hypothetical protein